jgi:hypothetical protein
LTGSVRVERPRDHDPFSLTADGFLRSERPVMGSLETLPLAERKVFDIPSLAEYLRLIGFTSASKSTVRGLIANGAFPADKRGTKRFYVLRADVDVWIARRAR